MIVLSEQVLSGRLKGRHDLANSGVHLGHVSKHSHLAGGEIAGSIKLTPPVENGATTRFEFGPQTFVLDRIRRISGDSFIGADKLARSRYLWSQV